MNKRQLSMLIGFLFLIGMFFTPVNGQDITKLVRIYENDSWTYETLDSNVEYTVNETFVNRFTREVNKISSNVSEPNVPFSTWIDTSYQYTNLTSEETTIKSGFFMTLDYTEFTEYYAQRGNYWHGCSGKSTITFQFGNDTFIIRKEGELWINPHHDGSQNLAIVTGEPQIEISELSICEYLNNGSENQKIDIMIHINYLLVPSDEYSTEWDKNTVTAISLTETIKLLDISVTLENFNNATYNYHFLYDDESNETIKARILGANTYIYANEIGLPIEIQKNIVFLNSQNPTSSKIFAKIDSIEDNNVETLIRYSINEAKSLSSAPVEFISIIVAIPVLYLIKYKRM